MDTFYTGLRKYWADSIFEIEGHHIFGINSWLKSGDDYQIYNQPTQGEFSVYVYDRKIILKPISTDIKRLSTAAFETLTSITPRDHNKRSTAWALIQLYYAAYYSAHSFMRLTGLSLTTIDKAALLKVNEIADLFGYSRISLKSGNWTYQYRDTNNLITFQKTANAASHEDLWKHFRQHLVGISSHLYRDFIYDDAIEMDNEIQRILASITLWGSNGGNWLSNIRNRITYRQEFGVWFPYEDKGLHQFLFKKIDLWKKDVFEYKHEKPDNILEEFILTCLRICSITFMLVKDVNDYGKKKLNYLEYGPLQFYNSYCK